MPRGGDRKTGKPHGENAIRYFPLCLWCGREFAAKRPDAQTCKPSHRVALNRYAAKHGAPPMFPFGVVPDAKKTGTKKTAPRKEGKC